MIREERRSALGAQRSLAARNGPRAIVRGLLLVASSAVALWIPAQLEARQQNPTGGGVGRGLGVGRREVSIVYFGPGKELRSRWGHTVLRVESAAEGTDLAYSFGLSDGKQGGLLAQLANPRGASGVTVLPAMRLIEEYAADGRSITVQRLELTAVEEEALLGALNRQVVPSANEQADFFRGNCTTRVRDVLDEALGGRLKAATEGLRADGTYRSIAAPYASDYPLLHLGLMVGLGDVVDRPLSLWEAMFLPAGLRDGITHIEIVEDGGAVRHIADRPEVWATSPIDPPRGRWGTSWGYLLVGLAVGVVLERLGNYSSRHALARDVFALFISLWLLAVGAVGMVLSWLWVFTDQTLAYNNANLFQMNLFAIVLLDRVWSGARGYGRGKLQARWCAVLVAAVAWFGPLLEVTFAQPQSQGPVLLLTLPAHLGLAIGIWRWSAAEEMAGPTVDDSAALELDGAVLERA